MLPGTSTAMRAKGQAGTLLEGRSPHPVLTGSPEISTISSDIRCGAQLIIPPVPFIELLPGLVSAGKGSPRPHVLSVQAHLHAQQDV